MPKEKAKREYEKVMTEAIQWRIWIERWNTAFERERNVKPFQD